MECWTDDRPALPHASRCCFDRLLVASPSVWWDDRWILKQVRQRTASTGQRIWLDIGTAEGNGMVQNARALRDGLNGYVPVARIRTPGADVFPKRNGQASTLCCTTSSSGRRGAWLQVVDVGITGVGDLDITVHADSEVLLFDLGMDAPMIWK